MIRQLIRPVAALGLATVLAAGISSIESRFSWTVTAQSQPSERDCLTRIRRLTIEGRRAGEGYWSKDGRQLVFQSEREPGNPFYQIYLMDMDSGNTTRVSDRKSVV